MAFPPDFTWGAATSSYQIEGAHDSDGKTPSVWDVFSAQPGKTYNNDTGRVACDHYNRYREDVALMKEMNLGAYRFSLSWPRILPDGRGKINPKGLDFYSRLVDSLLEAKITPWATLFHWDMPHILQQQGGWLNRDTADAFAEYTKAVVDVLGDRVDHWMTFNEPQCFLGLGLENGAHAPGLKILKSDLFVGLHNHLVAHGKSAQILREAGGSRFKIGYVPTTQTLIPASESAEDIEAAREAFFSYRSDYSSLWTVATYTDPVFFGRYPADGLAKYGEHLPKGWEKDMGLISTPIDFCGINLYYGYHLTRNEKGETVRAPVPAGIARTANNWHVEGETLRWAPRFLSERYKKPVVITENGLSLTDWVHLDGAVHDGARIDFTRRYLLGLEQAIADGADIAGYFHWSLMDNFEWGESYKERFGLIHVDFQTQKRTIKDSGYWYRDVMASNGKSLH
jgi:beta-glucosidase